MREYHPRINESQKPLTTGRIILGSFPIWSLTESELDDELTLSKMKKRVQNGDFQYFYGSISNKFWQWYQSYIDGQIKCNNVESISKSIYLNNIGITDMIFSCVRKGTSALDKHLSSRKYNYNFFEYPKKGETLKILCTSKGVMNDMLLKGVFFKIHKDIKLNEQKSNKLQVETLASLEGDNNLSKPIIRVLEIQGGGTIECFATPSPGSPYRRLIDFGYKYGDIDTYLNKYLKTVFQWFV
ncbi:hypothetical protein ACJVDH_19555 [Pedobacter sp. AW1-32]|uniref:hypothetical protein n=1 Tax=Pedobacter sp. AW1-32 TaxID=3383026 RepID=UPI003FEE756C